MDIKNAKFITSFAKYNNNDISALPQIAMVGKSNVGKSSLINALCNNKKLAKTSSTPGKTRLINIFETTIYDNSFEKKFNIVDLPGYGYAKVNQNEKIKWGDMIETYLKETDKLLTIFHLVDIRHAPTKDDISISNYMRSLNLPYKTIATKSDKISKAARMKHIAEICRSLNIQPWEVIPISSETKDGKDNILSHIYKLLQED